MSCNGCRVLRKGCSESCILRPCLQWIDTAPAQGHATLFVAKFFGRAGLVSFINGVSPEQRPGLFQSLLFEACGRTINPVTGAAGLLWTGNWHLCQAAVETVLRGGVLRPLPELASADVDHLCVFSEAAVETTTDLLERSHKMAFCSTTASKRGRSCSSSSSEEVDDDEEDAAAATECDLDICLTPGSPGGARLRQWSPSMNSEGSATTSWESRSGHEPRLLDLFV